MISICIPVYNYDVSTLLEALISQSNLLTVAVEIIVIDDASTENKGWQQTVFENVKYIGLSENIGRSKIRNLFLEYAKYDYMLFLDCDAMMCTDDFIANYIQAVKIHPTNQVFCGGRIYRDKKPERSKLLRWKYGVYKESQNATVREKHPNRSFMTNNFLIQRQTLKKHQFDERISTYGHEDTLFGYQLKKNNIAIYHLDNPILNGDLESNAEFLKKTEAAVKNLVLIIDYVNKDLDFLESISLLKFHKQLRSKKMISVVRMVSIIINPLIKKSLVAGYVNLKWFDFYKLGVFLMYNDSFAMES